MYSSSRTCSLSVEATVQQIAPLPLLLLLLRHYYSLLSGDAKHFRLVCVGNSAGLWELSACPGSYLHKYGWVYLNNTCIKPQLNVGRLHQRQYLVDSTLWGAHIPLIGLLWLCSWLAHSETAKIFSESEPKCFVVFCLNPFLSKLYVPKQRFLTYLWRQNVYSEFKLRLIGVQT